MRKKRRVSMETTRLCRRANAVGRLRLRIRDDTAARAVLSALLGGLRATRQISRVTSLPGGEVNAARRRLWRHASVVREEIAYRLRRKR